MFELQAELGDEWILRFFVSGKDDWLTAERKDGSQRSMPRMPKGS